MKYEIYKLEGEIRKSCSPANEGWLLDNPEIEAYKPSCDPDDYSFQKYDGLNIYQWYRQVRGMWISVGPVFVIDTEP